MIPFLDQSYVPGIGFYIAALVVAGIGAWSDWRTGEIPNWPAFAAILLAPIAHIIASKAAGFETSKALVEGGISICGALLCALIPMLLYSKDAIGGGDVKLFAALGALCDPRAGVELQMYSFFVAALIAPARLAYDGKLFRTLQNSLLLMVNPFLPQSKKRTVAVEMMSWLRLGPAILIGVAITAMENWRR